MYWNQVHGRLNLSKRTPWHKAPELSWMFQVSTNGSIYGVMSEPTAIEVFYFTASSVAYIAMSHSTLQTTFKLGNPPVITLKNAFHWKNRENITRQACGTKYSWISDADAKWRSPRLTNRKWLPFYSKWRTQTSTTFRMWSSPEYPSTISMSIPKIRADPHSSILYLANTISIHRRELELFFCQCAVFRSGSVPFGGVTDSHQVFSHWNCNLQSTDAPS